MNGKSQQTYIEVAVSAPIGRPLTYLPPKECNHPVVPGMRVLVPLGGRKTTGYVLAVANSAPADRKLKEILEVLDTSPLFPAGQVQFYKWIAGYYHFPIGEVIKTALPAGLTKKSGRRIVLTEAGRTHFQQNETEESRNVSWLSSLLERGELSPHATANLWSTKDRKILESWEKNGWISISSELVGGSIKIKTETCCALPENIDSAVDLKISEQKTIDVLKKLTSGANRRFVPRREIVREYPGAGRGLKSLARKSLVISAEQQVYRDPFGDCFLDRDIPASLSEDQKRVWGIVSPAIDRGKYTPFLLHGVTGSGKTEVYLQAARKTLDRGRGVLVLVPEIALTTQLEAHFLGRFGARVALLHSGLSPGQRFDQWDRIAKGKADVVIGARSAVFAPLADPGLIVVDEEHDSSYKQDDGFRYHGRDLAILRASQSDAVLILGSATPSVISYHHAVREKYHLLEMNRRIEDRPLPEVEIINMQSVAAGSKKTPTFSQAFINGLRENLGQGGQSLVFLNRRGFANFMICKECGQTVQCRHCQVSLTLHKAGGKLLCHYCGFTIPAKTLCANCRSSSLAAIGVGTERLEQDLAALMPEARIGRLDRDTCKKRSDYIKILKAVHKGEIDILLGTQMITKGHHFPNVTMVGIVLADTGLGLPDFRAGERTFQLISQVTGRAGRGERPGRVIIQTFQPEHHSIVTARNHDYAGMFRQEIHLRKSLGYPPFSRLVNIKIEGREEGGVRDTAAKLAALARKMPQNIQPEILGPAPAPLTRLKDRFRWQILLKSEKLGFLHNALRVLETDFISYGRGGRVKISVDVDPEYMM